MPTGMLEKLFLDFTPQREVYRDFLISKIGGGRHRGYFSRAHGHGDRSLERR